MIVSVTSEFLFFFFVLLKGSSENVSVSRNSDSALDKSSNLKKQFRQKRNDLFSTEQERQLKLLTKVDKIDVHVNDPAKGLDYKLKMNKNISTPLNCAMRKAIVFK